MSDLSHKLSGRLPILSAGLGVTFLAVIITPPPLASTKLCFFGWYMCLGVNSMSMVILVFSIVDICTARPSRVVVGLALNTVM